MLNTFRIRMPVAVGAVVQAASLTVGLLPRASVAQQAFATQSTGTDAHSGQALDVSRVFQAAGQGSPGSLCGHSERSLRDDSVTVDGLPKSANARRVARGHGPEHDAVHGDDDIPTSPATHGSRPGGLGRGDYICHNGLMPMDSTRPRLGESPPQ